MTRKTKAKSITVEESGVRISIAKYGEKWIADLRPFFRAGEATVARPSLGTGFRTEAEQAARTLAREIAKRRLLGRPTSADSATLDDVFVVYNRHKLSLLSDEHATSVKTLQALFREAWGGDLVVRTLTQQHVESYARARRAGTLTPLRIAVSEDGKVVKGRKPVPVRDATLNADFRWLASCFNLAAEQEPPLLSKNPLRRLKLPKEKNPRRPVASHERFARTLNHTDTVDPKGRLTCVLHLARYTGRRIDAILHLRVSDVLLTRERLHETLAKMGRDERLIDHMPYGAIRWRAENDKMGFDELAPIGPDTRAALDSYLRANPRLGDAVLFPAPENDTAFLGRRLVTRWLLKAEKLAKLPKLDQGCWHPYRRLWAVERKDLPDVDTAAAGGWRDTRALKLSYQQADPATMLRVVTHGR